MAYYVWDIGFDFEEVANTANDNLPLLKQGGVGFNPAPYKLPDVPQFNVGDTLSINVFNLTLNASLTDHVITSYEVLFYAPTGNIQSPCNSTIYQDANLTISATSTLPSVGIPFNGQIPCYIGVVTPGGIINNGGFAFTVYLTVRKMDGNMVRKFRVDPQMIVGGTN